MHAIDNTINNSIQYQNDKPHMGLPANSSTLKVTWHWMRMNFKYLSRKI